MKYQNSFFGLCELFWALIFLWTYSFLTVFESTNWIIISQDYLYLLSGILFILQICIVKWLLSGISMISVLRAGDAIQRLNDLIHICIYKPKSQMGLIFSLLCIHEKSCPNPNCLCHDLSAEYIQDDSNKILINHSVFTKNSEVPPIYIEGFFIKTLKILAEELNQQFIASEELGINIAELYFYYFGNHYYALEKVMLIQEKNPNILIRQRIYNLKQNIQAGLMSNYELKIDREKTVKTIDYLESYRKFIEKSEDLIELTLKFWSILLKDRPTASELNNIGRQLFECKQEIIKMISELTEISENNVEVLLRQGILLKNAMHDIEAAEQIFYKIGNAVNTSSVYSEHSRFSIFSQHHKTMFMAATFTNDYDVNIIQVNTEFEKKLGYKFKEIADCSASILMPSVISECHQKLVQHFFNTMESKVIENPIQTFLKCKNGLYLPCIILKKIIPRMNSIINDNHYSQLQVAVFIVEDRSLSKYISVKNLAIAHKTGAIICNGHNKIIGFTKTAVDTLKFSEHHLLELAKDAYLNDLFMQYDSNFLEHSGVAEKEGIIIKTKGLLSNDENSAESSLEISEQALNSAKSDKTYSYIWMQYTKSNLSFTTCAENTMNVLILSEIIPVYEKFLTQSRDLPYVHNIERHSTLNISFATSPMNYHKIRKFTCDDELSPRKHAENDRLIGDNNSQTSLSSENRSQPSSSNVSSRHSSKNNINNMNDSELNGTVPTSIKRLSIGILIILVGIISLICIFKDFI